MLSDDPTIGPAPSTRCITLSPTSSHRHYFPLGFFAVLVEEDGCGSSLVRFPNPPRRPTINTKAGCDVDSGK